MFPDDGRSICQKVASFNIIAHDVINLLYGIMNSEQTKIFLHINFVHPVSQSFFQSICKCHIYFTIPVLREYKFFSHNNFSCILIKHFKCLIKAVKWHNKLCSFSDQIFNLTRPKFASRHRLHFLQNLPRWKKKRVENTKMTNLFDWQHLQWPYPFHIFAKISTSNHPC